MVLRLLSSRPGSFLVNCSPGRWKLLSQGRAHVRILSAGAWWVPEFGHPLTSPAGLRAAGRRGTRPSRGAGPGDRTAGGGCRKAWAGRPEAFVRTRHQMGREEGRASRSDGRLSTDLLPPLLLLHRGQTFWREEKILLKKRTKVFPVMSPMDKCLFDSVSAWGAGLPLRTRLFASEIKALCAVRCGPTNWGGGWGVSIWPFRERSDVCTWVSTAGRC